MVREIAYNVHVVGLQRSGTTWMQLMLANNFENIYVGSRQKHSLPNASPPGAGEGLVVVMRKRLDHWLNSVQRFSGGLEKAYPSVCRGGVLDMVAAAMLYGTFYAEWGRLLGGTPGRPHIIADYEDVLRHPGAYLEKVERMVGCKRPIVRGQPQEWDISGPENDSMPPARVAYYLGTASRGER